MKTPSWTPWAAIAALFLLLVLAWRADRQAVADNAVTKALLAHADSAIGAAHKLEVRYDTVLVHDTVYLSRNLTRYKSLHDTVLTHLTDTVVVKQFVAAADTTIHACTRALNDCEQVTAALRLELAGEEGRAAALAKLRPTLIQRNVGTVAVLAGALGVYLGSRLQR